MLLTAPGERHLHVSSEGDGTRQLFDPESTGMMKVTADVFYWVVIWEPSNKGRASRPGTADWERLPEELC